MENKVKQYIMKAASEKGITVDHNTDLFESGVFDSLEIIEFLTYLEEELRISFEWDDLNYENFQSMDTIIQWIEDNGKDK